MGLLSKLRNLIGTNQKKSLPVGEFNKIDFDKTMPFITIDAITSLIYNKEIFEKYMHFDENKDFFKDLTKESIARAVKEYADFMLDKGEKFNIVARNRIRKMEENLSIEESNKKTAFKQYTGINKRYIYDLAINIVSSKDKLEEFLECQRQNQLYQGIPTFILFDYISSELYDFTSNIVLTKPIMDNVKFIKEKKEKLTDSAWRVDSRNFELNEDFERNVLQSIYPTNDPAVLALQLYNELNKRVKYNPSFFALDQNLQDSFANNIYNKPFNEVNSNDNNLVCKQWAELYAYILDRYGFESYLCGDGLHKYVKGFWGSTFIEADATNLTNTFDDESRLTDLTRAKLGVRPAGFSACEYSEKKFVARNMSKIPLNYDVISYLDDTGVNEQIIQIMNLIKDGRKVDILLEGLNTPDDVNGSIVKKLGFISDMLRRSQLDNMDSSGYLNHLFHGTFSNYEMSRVTNTNIFYENLYTNDCNMIPIISVNTSPYDNASAENYMYYIFEQESHSIMPIERDELIRRVVSGRYIQGRGKSENKCIPGLPEITDKEFIMQAREQEMVSQFRGGRSSDDMQSSIDDLGII